ncbi:thiol:disulfide interchange protein DsbD [Janthinobacterium sp. Marseille]|nr:protein-disulfide reductase DsbD [Janthinobacterium sp. Marseille]ABR91616.1 thiol:disulfide interchange protein DsbD [Janthinobacterium sp. Marseille]MBX9799202.1 protein-disulfide reductase DsbD [Burkholderiaceae bacterium]
MLLLLVWSCVPWAWSAPSMSSAEATFLEPSEVLKLTNIESREDNLVVQTNIADQYYVYRHSLSIKDASNNNILFVIPDGEAKHDEFFGDTEIYKNASLRFQIPNIDFKLPLTLQWQGCSEGGICYPPQTQLIHSDHSANEVFRSKQLAWVSDSQETSTNDKGEDQLNAQRLTQLGPVGASIVFLGLGLLLAFAPCSLPMIPIVSTMVIGTSTSVKRNLTLTAAYVLAMASTYAVLGVVTGLAGSNVQSALQSPWLLGTFAVLFLILAASMFGWFEFQLPSYITNKLSSLSGNRAQGSIVGSVLLGFASAILVGPCMTAPLAGALLYIGQTGDAATGGFALFSLGLGMGLPLFLIAVFGTRILPKPGAWMDRMRVAFGYVMVAMAIYFGSRFLPDQIVLAASGMLGIAITVGTWFLGSHYLASRKGWTFKIVSLSVGLWSVLMVVGAASGGNSLLRPLGHFQAVSQTNSPSSVQYVPAKSAEDIDRLIQDAATRGQSTMIDFYADWCVSCHIFEKEVLGNDQVIARLKRVQVIRPDVTAHDEHDKRLLSRWGVLGPPTIIFVGADGKEKRALRSVGEINTDQFLARLDKAGM